ncbi:helix-turn-helix transcriptional regulator [Sphaerisporangium sp. NPDC051011]|uniref:helix-turn-helix domain-containing protein n=1 Tax=Sphaerisporangium sp. NPDC051011 TaxID=3155792 RepID=UPI0033FAAB55
MATKSPTVRQRRLGRELRQLREAAGLSSDAAATQLGWSRPKVSRIENARTMPSTVDVADACDLYGADSAIKAGLIQLCRDASRRGWWTAYSDVFTGSYVALEAEATSIRTWQPLLIPGLLQSEDYARAIIQAARPGLAEVELERRTDARMARKINLLGSTPTLHALIDESVLCRSVGPPEIMRRQLDDMLQVAAWPNITIQVIPSAVGPHAGLEGPFTILEFNEPDPAVGYVESQAGDVYVEAADQVRSLTLTIERLIQVALSPEESVAFITTFKERS